MSESKLAWARLPNNLCEPCLGRTPAVSFRPTDTRKEFRCPNCRRGWWADRYGRSGYIPTSEPVIDTQLNTAAAAQRGERVKAAVEIAHSLLDANGLIVAPLWAWGPHVANAVITACYPSQPVDVPSWPTPKPPASTTPV